ncbi:MAG TPA: cytochrome c, partial [Vicinamibacteria bacterium]|nr:cytochrome c [Vicinamibacteria bacterium]
MAFLVVGCRQDMHNQPKLKAFARSEFYPDHRASRPQVEGTVARGQLTDESAFYTGKVDGQLTSELPVPLTPELLAVGRTR